MDMSLSKLWEMVQDREGWRAIVHGVAKRHDWATEQSKQKIAALHCCIIIIYTVQHNESAIHIHMTLHFWDFLTILVTAAAAKSLQSCPTLCDPTDGSPPGSPVPGILQARTLEWVAISFSNAWMWKVKVKSFSCVWLLATPWTAAYQAPPSMGFSRQKYWSGVPLPSPFWSLQCIKQEFSVLHSTFSLVIHFWHSINSVYV